MKLVEFERPPINPEIEELSRKIHEANSELLQSLNQKRDAIFMECLRTIAEPPMKGELTKGKLTWRGIKMCYNPDRGEYWIEQRGKAISPRLKLQVLTY